MAATVSLVGPTMATKFAVYGHGRWLLFSGTVRNGTPSSVKYLFYGTVPKHTLDSYLRISL